MPADRGDDVRCPSCDAEWPDPHARWCGTCGAALRPAPSSPTAAAPGTRTPRRYRRTVPAAATAAIAVLVAAAALAQRTGSDESPVAAEPPPDEGDVVEVDPDDVDEAVLEPTCLLDDCLRWSVPLDDPDGDLVTANEEVVVVGDGPIVRAMDVADGSVRWERTDLEVEEVSIHRDALFTISDDELVAIDLVTGEDRLRDAARSWTRAVWDVAETDDGWIVAGGTVGEDGRASRATVVAFDDTGRERWAANGDTVAFSAEGAAVVDDGALRSLDDDGEPRWERTVGTVRFLAQAGPAIQLGRPGEEDDELVRRSDGSPFELEGVPLERTGMVSGARALDGDEVGDDALPDVAGLWVDEDGGSGIGELVLLEGDDVAWSVRTEELIEDPAWESTDGSSDGLVCCLLRIDDETVQVQGVGGPVVLDRADGAVRDAGARPRADPVRPGLVQDVTLIEGQQIPALFLEGTPVVALPDDGSVMAVHEEVTVVRSGRWLFAVEVGAG